MKAMFLAAAVLMCLAAEAARLESQMTASRSAVEMTGVKPVLKMQTAVEGFLTPLNGKPDLPASEVDIELGGSIKDHYPFGPGLPDARGEITLIFADTRKSRSCAQANTFANLATWTSPCSTAARSRRNYSLWSGPGGPEGFGHGGFVQEGRQSNDE